MTPSSPAATSPDAETIRRLVTEVLARLGAEGKPAPAAPLVTPSAPATGSPVSTGVTLAGRVISLGMLEKLPSGTARVVVETAAVITPSAREYARDKGITIERASAGSRPAGVPFIVARAECAKDASSQAAALARAVPGGVQLPATGLADVATALALHASRDGARGVLLTSKPATALILANRSASLRAVTARDPSALAAAITETAANLIIVDPATFPASALVRLAVDLATRPASEVPAALAARPAGCGCKGH
jgi:hypothetical protein